MATILLHTSPTRGRYLTANAPIEADTAILVALPIAATPLDSHKKKVCGSCLSQAPKAHVLRCLDCDQSYFCSKQCLETAAIHGHGLVCKALRRLATSKASAHEKSLMKLVLLLLLRRRNEVSADPVPGLQKLPSIQETMANGADSVTVEIEEPLVPRVPNWQDVLNLQSHYGAWSDEAKKEWKKCLALVMSALEESCLLEGFDDSGEGLENVVMHLVSRIESNGFGLWALKRQRVDASLQDDVDRSSELISEISLQNEAVNDAVESGEVFGTGACIGRAVYPFASYFNHSCDPSCEPVQYQDHLMFKTRRRIEKGDELTISYMDTNMPLTNRRSLLQQDYFFDCQCVRCVTESSSKPNQRDKVSFTKSHAKKQKAQPPKKKKAEAAGNVYE